LAGTILVHAVAVRNSNSAAASNFPFHHFSIATAFPFLETLLLLRPDRGTSCGMKPAHTRCMNALACALVLLTLLGSLVLGRSAEKSLSDKVLAFCQISKGRMVGNGQCSSLAERALAAAGASAGGEDAPGPEDYSWGRQIFYLARLSTGLKTEGQQTDIKPGCIIQFRDVRWEGKTPRGTYWMEMEHHTAVVAAVEDNGKMLRVFHQNYGNNKLVTEAKLRLNDLRKGWLRVYEPTPPKPHPSP
jgi:hypothetical protein